MWRKVPVFAKSFYRLLLITLLIASNTACNQKQTRSYQGYVEGENIYLASPYSGVLLHLAVNRGDTVSKNQLLFQLDPDPEQLRVKQSENDLQAAVHTLKDMHNPLRLPEIELIKAQIQQVEARIDLAQIRVSRNQQLYTRKATDKDTLDASIAGLLEQQKLKAQYQSSLELAQMGSRDERINAQEAQVALLKDKLNEIKWQLAQKTVLAPASGLVFDTYYRQGEFVATQQPVLSLLTPDNVRIEFFVPVESLENLSVGQKIQFQCDGCDAKDEATISYISPEAQYIPPLVYSRENNEKLVFRIKAKLNSFNRYKPGQPVMVFVEGP